MSFTDILKKSFPFISAAASLGGPVGTMAATLVGKALGVDKVPATAEGISNVIATAFADPAQRTALVQAEQQFQAQMAELGYKDVETLAATDEADRASARNREVQVRDYTPEVGFYLMAAIYCLALFCLFRFPIPPDNKALIYSGMGTLGALLGAAANYFYGTSRGSERKTELIAAAPAIQK